MDDCYVPGPAINLTSREQEILQRVAEGLNYDEIALQLFLSTGTVKTTMQRVRDKLRARSSAHAVLIAERHFPEYLRPVIALHGTREGAQAHLRLGQPLCPDCDACDPEEGPTVKVVPIRKRIPKSSRLRPGDPVECGTMQAVRRHRSRGDQLSKLTCGCREANAAWHRDYQRRRRELAAAA